MPTSADVAGSRSLGRYMEPAMWVLLSLREGPRQVVRLFDDVRLLDGPIGPGTLFAAVARLERLDLVETSGIEGGRRAYRLTQRGVGAAASVEALKFEAGP